MGHSLPAVLKGAPSQCPPSGKPMIYGRVTQSILLEGGAMVSSGIYDLIFYLSNMCWHEDIDVPREFWIVPLNKVSEAGNGY